MIAYFDSSSLVKLYVDEPCSQDVEAWRAASRAVATSVVARPEILSALSRRAKEGSISLSDARKAATAIAKDWGAFLVVEVDAEGAGEIALKHAIRGFDAIHVAAALRLARLSQEADVEFSSFDGRQIEAARSEGLEILEP